MHIYTYTCRIHIDAIITDERRLLKKKYISHFIWKVVSVRELDTEQRLQQIDLPSPSGHHRVSFSFSWAAQPCACGPSLSGTYCHSSIFSLTGLVSKLNQGSRGPLLLGGGFLYHISSPTHLSPTHWLPVYTELYNSSIAHSIFGMACLLVIKRKKTVMHFTGHSLSVHQFMSVPWDFYLVPYFSQPAYITSSHNWNRNVSLPFGASLWNGMFGRVEGQYTKICSTISSNLFPAVIIDIIKEKNPPCFF